MKIFKGRGTPALELWPQMKDLPLFKPDYPQYQPQSLAKLVPGLDELGLDLLDKMLKCNPAERITAKDAMLHPYLKDVDDYIKNMK
jgi:cyclin-dependent kinase